MKKTAINSFNEGLNIDAYSVMKNNQSYSDALNATLITMNGDDMVLQNDMGNITEQDWHLKEGYIPVGMKEHGGILYIVSYNPTNGHSEIGSFPSPSTSEEDIFSDETHRDIVVVNDITNDFANKTRYVYQIFPDKNIYPGDKFKFKFNDTTNSLAHELDYNLGIVTEDSKIELLKLDKDYTVSINNNVYTFENPLNEGNYIYYKGSKKGRLILLFSVKLFDDFELQITTNKVGNNTTVEIISKAVPENLITNNKSGIVYSNGQEVKYSLCNSAPNLPKLTITSVTDETIDYKLWPFRKWGEQQNLTISGKINTALINTGAFEQSKWKYRIANNTLYLLWDASHYPKEGSIATSYNFTFYDLLNNETFTISCSRQSKINWTGTFIDQFKLGPQVKENTCYVVTQTFNTSPITVFNNIISTFNLYDESLFYNENKKTYNTETQSFIYNIKSSFGLTNNSYTDEYIYKNIGASEITNLYGKYYATTQYGLTDNLELTSNSSLLIPSFTGNLLNGYTINSVNVKNVDRKIIGSNENITLINNNTSITGSNIDKTYVDDEDTLIRVKITNNDLLVKTTNEIKSTSISKQLLLTGYELKPYFDSLDTERMNYLFGFNPYGASNPQIKLVWTLRNHGYKKAYDGISYYIDHSQFWAELQEWQYDEISKDLTSSRVTNTFLSGEIGNGYKDSDFDKILGLYISKYASVPRILFISSLETSESLPNIDVNKRATRSSLFNYGSQSPYFRLSGNDLTALTPYRDWVGIQWKTNSKNNSSYGTFNKFYKRNHNLDYSGTSGSSIYKIGTSKLITVLDKFFSTIYVGQPNSVTVTKYVPKNTIYNQQYDLEIKLNITTNALIDITLKYDDVEIKSKLHSAIDALTLTNEVKTTLKQYVTTMFTYNTTLDSQNTEFTFNHKTNDIVSKANDFHNVSLTNKNNVWFKTENNELILEDDQNNLLNKSSAYILDSNRLKKLNKYDRHSISDEVYKLNFAFDVVQINDYQELLLDTSGLTTESYMVTDCVTSYLSPPISEQLADAAKITTYKIIN